jgi:PAS domain S-box-containing protein
MTALLASPLTRLDRWIPVEVLRSQDDAARLRLRLLVGASLAIGFLAMPYVLIFLLVFGAPLNATALGLECIAMLATPFVLQRTGSREIAAHWFLGSLVLTLSALAAVDGGQGVAIHAFVITPMFASATTDVRTTLAYSAVSIAAVLILAFATAAGVPFPAELSAADHVIFHPAVSVGLVLAIGMPALLYRALTDAALGDVAAKESEIRAIVDTAADAIVSLDAEGRIVSANRAAERLFQRTPSDLVGRRLAELVEGSWRADLKGQEVKIPLAQRRIDAEIAVGRVQDAAMELHVATLRDVTLRKEAERTIADARDRAVEATRAKSDFLANMSHELRTPLNAIIGYSEMLVEDAADTAPAMLRDLGKIGDAGRHLLQLINDILDLSKIEAGRMELSPEWIDVGLLARGVAETVGPLAEKHGNSVQVDVPDDAGRIWADVTRMRQVLLNLLSNAAKFTERGAIRLTARRETGMGAPWLVFEVSDTGIGIAPGKLERVFGEFEQGDASTTRKYGGTGLGLAITRRLCRMMGGDVTVRSVVGEGSTFTVRVPVRTSGGIERKPTPSMALYEGEPGAPLVLVIDDDPDARDLLARTLSRGGYRVELASDGKVGIELCRRLSPVAVTLDVLMPGMDGWQVLSQMKADPQLSRVPVVLVSMVEDRSMGFALGATQYLTKPVDRDLLLATLEPYRAGSPGRALVVEDDAALRELVSRTLEKAGWEVRTASNGQEGLAEVEMGRPDLVLLDLMMPVMDGFEFLARLRQDERHADLPVIVVTARDLSPDERHRLHTQAQRVLQKAVTSQDELLRQVASTVARFAPRPEPVA